MRALVSLLVLLAVRTAFADGTANQLAAEKLYKEGNELAAQESDAAALEKYKQALELWDEPRIRFNKAIVEIHLDHVLDAADDLEAALRATPTPFSPEQRKNAINYQTLLAKRIGNVEVSCSQQGASVQLDGKQWFACPGTQTRRVLAGEHVVGGEAKGYMPLSERMIVSGGKTAQAKVALVSIESVTKIVYPTRRWLPWTTAGSGLAIAVAGFGVWFAGRRDMDRFDERFKRVCVPACSENFDANITEQQLAELRDGAQLKGTIGISMMIGGGAIGVVGAIWVVMNRPTRVLPKLEVAPANGGMTAHASWSF
jgi:hypothetical protein